jgi:hypothetical protein
MLNRIGKRLTLNEHDDDGDDEQNWNKHDLATLIDIIYKVRGTFFVEAVSILLSVVWYQHVNRRTN